MALRSSCTPLPLAARSDDDGLPFLLLLYPRLRWLLSAIAVAFLCCTSASAGCSQRWRWPSFASLTMRLTPLTVLLLTPLTASVPPTAPLSLPRDRYTTAPAAPVDGDGDSCAALHADFAWPGLPPVHNLLRAWSTAPAGHLLRAHSRSPHTPQPDYPLGIKTSLVTMPQVSVLYSATMAVSHRV
jgi:hypothetical protein